MNRINGRPMCGEEFWAVVEVVACVVTAAAYLAAIYGVCWVVRVIAEAVI